MNILPTKLVCPLLFGAMSAALVAVGMAAEKAAAVPNPDRGWFESLPSAPRLELKKHGLAATELRRWRARGANQGVAVDANYFYGIGNFIVGKYDKKTGDRVNEWIGLRGGTMIHMNSGYVENGTLIVSHSNYPGVPMMSSVEFFDAAAIKPMKSISLGMQQGSLTWAFRRDGYWWACFANYSGRGGTPGRDNSWTYFAKFTENWQPLEQWTFPASLIAAFNGMSASGGAWGDDGFLYVTGHDAPELYVLRLPKMGSVLQLVTVIDVPFAGQAWAWDPSEHRVIYGITRQAGEVVVARIPDLPSELRQP